MSKDALKPKAMRLYDETMERFRVVAAEMGAENQEQALTRLLEVYESETAKVKYPEMKENLDTFEGYVRAALSMYKTALESVQDMRALVRTEYDAQLRAKDKIITELQERTEKAEQLINDAMAVKKENEQKILVLERQLRELNEQVNSERRLEEQRHKEEQLKYQNLYSVYESVQLSETEIRKSCNAAISDNERLRSELDEAKEKFGKEKAGYAVSLREKDAVIEEETRKSDIIRQELIDLRNEYENSKALSAVTLQMELQKQEIELKKNQEKEVAELRKERDKYMELYYQNK